MIESLYFLEQINIIVSDTVEIRPTVRITRHKPF